MIWQRRKLSPVPCVFSTVNCWLSYDSVHRDFCPFCGSIEQKWAKFWGDNEKSFMQFESGICCQHNLQTQAYQAVHLIVQFPSDYNPACDVYLGSHFVWIKSKCTKIWFPLTFLFPQGSSEVFPQIIGDLSTFRSELLRWLLQIQSWQHEQSSDEHSDWIDFEIFQQHPRLSVSSAWNSDAQEFRLHFGYFTSDYSQRWLQNWHWVVYGPERFSQIWYGTKLCIDSSTDSCGF